MILLRFTKPHVTPIRIHSIPLTIRGILYRRLEDFTAAIEDLVQAIELSETHEEVGAQAEKDEPDSLREEATFQLVLTYNDFAVQCFSRGLYAEATLLLNKAVEEEKGQAGLYLNRGGEAWLPRRTASCLSLRRTCITVRIENIQCDTLSVFARSEPDVNALR